MPGVGKSVALTYKERIHCAKKIIKARAERAAQHEKDARERGYSWADSHAATKEAYETALVIIEGQEMRNEL